MLVSKLNDNPIESFGKMRKEFMCEEGPSSLIKGYKGHIAARSITFGRKAKFAFGMILSVAWRHFWF